MEASRYQEVLAKVEKLMPAAELERRITSAPEPKSATEAGFLPVITEEPLPNTLKVGKKESAGTRSFTAPHAGKQAVDVAAEDTIRVVAPSPQSVNRAQTEYRRKSLTAAEEIERPKTADGNRPTSNHLQVPNPRDQLLRKNSHDSAVDFKMHGALQNDVNILPIPEAITKKKSSWFKRWKDGKEPQPTAASTQQTIEPHPGVPVQFKELDDRELAQPNVLKRDKQAPQPIKVERPTPYTAPSSASSEFPLRKSPAEGESSKLSRWLNKLSGDKKDEPIKAIEIKGKPFSSHLLQHSANPISDGVLLSPNPSSNSPPTSQFPITPSTPSAPTSSWFSRFLRLKPEQRILCFSVPRGRARSETYKLLRDWQKHGITDLCYFPQENMITARVDRINALGIKPVAFRVELFVVLQNGRKVGLSLGRWTQTRGAASSFRQVVEVVEQTMREKMIMVADVEKCRELEGILG